MLRRNNKKVCGADSVITKRERHSLLLLPPWLADMACATDDMSIKSLLSDDALRVGSCGAAEGAAACVEGVSDWQLELYQSRPVMRVPKSKETRDEQE